MNITKYKHAPCTVKPNFIKIPVSNFPMTEEGAHEFNVVLDYVLSKKLNAIKRTPSNGISYKTRFPAYDMRANRVCVEITLIEESGMYRFQFRSNGTEIEDGETKKMYGRQAFAIFKKKCAENGIDLESYAIDNGEEVKKEIEKPYIKFGSPFVQDRIYENAHHIDFHNSYPAGLCNTHPEFRAVIEPLYKGRKEHPEYKQVLNLTVGFMQSIPCTKARWAHLSKDAIADNNRRIEELTKRLRESGHIILSYNTDGIWYIGDIYHGEGEGSNLGDWENDHVNCRFRAKSPGSYEFIEDGTYYPVVRGQTKLDIEKPRSQWVWGDIYNKSQTIKFEYREDGIYKHGVRC